MILMDDEIIHGPVPLLDKTKEYWNPTVTREAPVTASDEPSYYNSNGLSPLQAFRKGLLSEEEYRGFLKGNIIKYTIRCDKKNGAEDMDKCINYCKHLRDIL